MFACLRIAVRASASVQPILDKLPQTRWLTIEIYSLTVLEDRSLKVRCLQGYTTSEGSKGGYFLASSSFRWLPAPAGVSFQFMSPSPCSHFSSVCLYVQISLLMRIPVIGFKAHSNSAWFCLNLFTSVKTLFLNNASSQVLGLGFFEGHESNLQQEWRGYGLQRDFFFFFIEEKRIDAKS